MSQISTITSGLPTRQEITTALREGGWLLLRQTRLDLPGFSAFFEPLCGKLTFDPARQFASSVAQTVDAGQEAVGLHIENGNTPLPPDLVAFFSARSASEGAQTTICDGAAVYRALPAKLREHFAQPYTMTRRLPQIIWQRYVAKAMHIDDESSVSLEQLARFIDSVPGQSYELEKDGSICYHLRLSAIRDDNVANTPAFANALLGPSYNYEPPSYRLADGGRLEQALLDELAAICETFTEEIQWRDGDIAIIDNKRCLHGRRAIPVPLSERDLYIAMGSGAPAIDAAHDKEHAA